MSKWENYFIRAELKFHLFILNKDDSAHISIFKKLNKTQILLGNKKFTHSPLLPPINTCAWEQHEFKKTSRKV